MNSNQELTYTLTEAAEAIQVSRPTMLTLVHQSGFPSFRVGRRWIIPVEGLRRWLDEQVELAQVERTKETQPGWFGKGN